MEEEIKKLKDEILIMKIVYIILIVMTVLFFILDMKRIDELPKIYREQTRVFDQFHDKNKMIEKIYVVVDGEAWGIHESERWEK